MLHAGSGQILSVTFTPTDSTDYASITGTATINVQKATPIITWPNPTNVTYGTALGATELDATASVPGTFSYTPGEGTILKAGAGQTLSATFTPTDTTDYTTASVTASINVTTATPVITWPNPADITYGTALSNTQFDATASVPGTFTYNPAAGTQLSAGTGQTLSVSFTPEDTTDYTGASATVTINVDKATPTIIWANPQEITYGTPLSATQLDATASVPGTLTYSPLVGTILNAGAGQTLSVSFTPTDTSDYTTATATATINVGKATPMVTWTNLVEITYGTPLGSASSMPHLPCLASSITRLPPALS